MQVLDILVVIALFSIGFTPYILVKRFSKVKIGFFESLLVIFIFSFSLVCFPLILFGTLGDRLFFKYYTFFLTIVSLSFIIYYILRNFHNLFKLINYYDIEDSSAYTFVALVFAIAAFTYLFHAWILPLRGYDALNLYFPDAILFNLTKEIPLFNPFNFFPVVKEPLNSLLYSYSLSLVNQISVDLVILLIILLWAGLTYYLTLLFFPSNRNLAFLSFLMFLFFPLNFWFLDQWFYYQDIFLGFFFTCTIYFTLKSFDSSNSKSQILFYAVLSGLSFSLSLISKSSGWILVFIIIALFLFYSSHQIILKSYYIILFSSLTVIGFSKFSFILIPFFIIILLLIIYHSTPDKFIINSFKSNRIATILIIGIGVVLGGYWFYYMFYKFITLLGPSYTRLLVSNFFASSNSSATKFSTTSIYFTFENSYNVNFFSMALLLLIGNLFAIFYALPKVLSLLKRSNVSVLVIWVLIFFSFWVVLDSSSIRYLTPVITPSLILTVQGFLVIKSKLTFLYHSKFLSLTDVKEEIVAKFSSIWILIILSLGLCSLYLPIPLNTLLSLNRNGIARAYLLSAYIYYSNWFILVLIFIIFPIVVYFIFLKFNLKLYHFRKLSSFFNPKVKAISFSVFILFLFIFPNIPLFGTFYSSNFNVYQTQQTYDYDYRPDVQELINVLYSTNDPTAGVMVYDTPGIPVWIGNPTYDIYSAKYILNPLFSSNNITEGLQILLNPYSYLASVINYTLPKGFALPSIDYIVIPNVNNLYYNSFMNSFRTENYFFALVQNPNYFQLYYENSDFLVYKREFTTPSYYGIYDLGLQFNKKQIPILGSIPQYSNLSSSIQGYANFYFLQNFLKNLHLINGYISLNTTITSNGTVSILQHNFTVSEIPNASFNLTWSIPNISTFNLDNISIRFTFFDSQGSRHFFSWSFDANPTLKIIKNKNNQFSLVSDSGMTYS